jgi:hypothetical protein
MRRISSGTGVTGDQMRDRRNSSAAGDRSHSRDSQGSAPGRSTLIQLLEHEGERVPRAPVQQRAEAGRAEDPDRVHAAAQHGLEGPAQALPYLDLIQRSFGAHDVSGVRAHVGGPAEDASREMGAMAYATGDAVAFRGAPDLHTAAHEAAHVVQQRSGVHLKSGVGSHGDEYERAADAVADRVVAGQSAADLLPGPGFGGADGQSAVQRRDEEGAGTTEPMPAESGFKSVVRDTFLYRYIGGEQNPLRRTTNLLRAQMVVRTRPSPANEPAQPGYEYIATAAEQRAWARTADLSSIPSSLVPPTDSRIGEGAPNGEMPTIAVEDYDDLHVLQRETPLYAAASTTAEQRATVAQMETVVYLNVTAEDGQWQRVRLIRQQPLEGWIQPNGSFAIEPTAPVATGLSGDPSLRLGNPNANPPVEPSHGPDVIALRQALQALDPPIPAGDAASDTFDDTLRIAVEAFQERVRPAAGPVDGVFGTRTAQALRDVQNAANGVTAPAYLPTGTWHRGYRLKSTTPGRSLTADGLPARAGQGKVSNYGTMVTEEDWDQYNLYIPVGPIEVLKNGDTIVTCVDRSDTQNSAAGVTCWFGRGAAEAGENGAEHTTTGAGWISAAAIEPIEGEEEAQTSSVVGELQQMFPNGFTVVFVTNFADRSGEQFGTFQSEGSQFALQQHAVAIQGQQIVTGTVNLITHKREVISVLAGIQQALRGEAAEVPTWARAAHVAFFTHGWRGGWNWGGGIQTDAEGGEGDLEQDDLVGFARSLSAFVTSDVNVSLFSCWTGSEETEGSGWGQQPDQKGGEGSFADDMADELAETGATDARVMGHTTRGHTTNNPAARLFEGGEWGGNNLFNWCCQPITSWLGPEIEAARPVLVWGDPLETIEQTIFSWFTSEVAGDYDDNTQLETRMNSDPEIFRAEIRTRGRSWLVRHMMDEWGVIPDGSTAQLAVAWDANPTYLDGTPASPPKIPGSSPLTIESASAGGRAPRIVDNSPYYPITWPGDPYPGTAWLLRRYITITPPAGM